MYKCDICGKEEKFDGCVWYTFDMPETNLCRSHYLRWCHHIKAYNKAHKHIKPNTPEWSAMCKEQARLFIKWLKTQK